MNVLNPHHDGAAVRQALAAHTGLRVACYCAAWCRACTEYRPGFEALAARMPDALFLWIDVEDSPELLGDDDVEDFPTLLVQDAGGTRFWGTMLPHVQHLERLLREPAALLPATEAGPGDLRELVQAAA